MVIGLVDGTILRWEFPRLQMNDGITFIEELRSISPTTRPPNRRVSDRYGDMSAHAAMYFTTYVDQFLVRL